MPTGEHPWRLDINLFDPPRVTLFKGELRMQTYIDIIKPSCLEGSFFLNICGGNKAHIVAHVSFCFVFPYLHDCILEYYSHLQSAEVK